MNLSFMKTLRQNIMKGDWIQLNSITLNVIPYDII